MSKIMNEIEQAQIEKLTANKNIPNFRSGDTLKVGIRIVEGTASRTQFFEGVCIGIRNKGIMSSFVVRKMSHDCGVEKLFPLYSPALDSIEVVKRGKVRRGKLTYLRGRTGKAARIVERKEPSKA
jgi:large subunit ribosomal protein L19